MGTHANNPLIAVHRDTKERLDKLGKKGRSYNSIIVELLDARLVIKPEGFDPKKKICHGLPMRKVEFNPGKFGYKCDECLTLMMESTS